MSGPADVFPPMPCDRVLPVSDRPTVAELIELLRHVGPETVVWVAHGPAGARELTFGATPPEMSPSRAGSLIIRLPAIPPSSVSGDWPAPLKSLDAGEPPGSPDRTATPLIRLRRLLTSWLSA